LRDRLGIRHRDWFASLRIWLRRFIVWQTHLSTAFDRLIDSKYRIDGHDDFKKSILPLYIRPGMVIYDVGGGSRPYVDRNAKSRQELTIVGLDIDQSEMDAAPSGTYDQMICADLTRYVGQYDADLVICQSALEHVRDTERAFSALATIVRPCGHIAVFVPSRNALFARINLLLPERFKRFLLFNIFPHKAEGHEGFRAYYDRCTPRDFRAMALRHGFKVELEKFYFTSSYFSFFAPLHILWRLWVLVFHRIAGDQAAETFAMVLRRSGFDAP
jgi:2-polyprenyl-6-hydroxyphenyl methylase/3-demethylubiquinone-9 3-methyltransferase